MVIVQSRDVDTSATLQAELRPSGELVVTARVASPEGSDGSDDYEAVYTVRADEVPRLCALLAVDPGELLEGLQGWLAPHGTAAAATWRAWLKAHDVAYELTVR